MEVDSEKGVLEKIAAGGEVEEGTWLDLRADIIARLDETAHNVFPIPNLPPPPPPPAPTIEGRLISSPLPSSPLEHPSSQEANKENAPAERPAEPHDLVPGELPKQIDDMLTDIKKHLDTFRTDAPHTIQRLAELTLSPRAHYKALAPYLHAVDRVVRVTSGARTYPLPPAVSDMSGLELNGEEPKDPAESVTWSNPTVTALLGTDEALGGALLTPIPWLARRSPEGNGNGSDAGDAPAAGAQIHSEGTETIDGPNGMGRVETVSVSVNGIPSTGHGSARGVTQGELLRQEQRAGVVPVSQLARNQESSGGEDDKDKDSMEDEEDEAPHARGPEEIGVGDTGPQGTTTSYMGEDGVSMKGIDVEAAVGRKHEDERHAESGPGSGSGGVGDGKVKDDDDASSTSSTESGAGTKREAEQELESEHAKKIKDDEGVAHDAVAKEEQVTAGSADHSPPVPTATAATAATTATTAEAGSAGAQAESGPGPAPSTEPAETKDEDSVTDVDDGTATEEGEEGTQKKQKQKQKQKQNQKQKQKQKQQKKDEENTTEGGLDKKLEVSA
ncbi:hypothetical protein QQS21_007732 [Conoideocrella luteorostrata]|uniref:PPP4R2-domain-containing protein n=1 Tax=Conoideocrella luteorostrata TaxID=1105319 RepID=A0AAJ0CK59_9HYPO|nr:hypothetical protein QQS21_007732 [Conoideocrella luteorostrata]